MDFACNLGCIPLPTTAIAILPVKRLLTSLCAVSCRATGRYKSACVASVARVVYSETGSDRRECGT